MTSSNGNISRVTVLSCGEFTGHRNSQQFPAQRPVARILFCFLWSVPESTVQQTMETPVIWRHSNGMGMCDTYNGPLTKYVKLRVAHAPGMPGTFSPPPQVNDPDMHHGTCVTHVPWCMPGSLTSDFLWRGWLGKRSQHSRYMRNPQFRVSGKRPMDKCSVWQSSLQVFTESVGSWLGSWYVVGVYSLSS